MSWQLSRWMTVISVATALCAVAGAARAETAKLELKRLGHESRPELAGGAGCVDLLCRMTYPQSFFKQMGTANSGMRVINDPMEESFRRLVKKEPKYVLKEPFRGVAKLGSQEYVFALDAKDEKSGGFERLYFDLNHNGDLTDDKPIDAEPVRGYGIYPSGYSQHTFPRVDLMIEAGGKKMAYSFLFRIYAHKSKEFSYASASLNAGAYREGQITLAGKRHHVVVVDFNSNGRFDDELKLNAEVRTPDGRQYMERGDVLLVDPDPKSMLRFSGYNLLPHDDCHHQMSKLVNIDGRFYDLKITPAGDEISLTPCALPVGRVTNPNQGFRALLYGDKGTVAVSGDKSNSAAVPSGRWKLLAYTIDRTGLTEPPAKKPPAEKPKKEAPGDAKKAKKEGGSLLEALARILTGAAESAVPTPSFGMPRSTLVSAEATAKCKPIEVRAGQTVALPFGPPYKPVVKVQFLTGYPKQTEARLDLALVGSAGEVCTDLMVDGARPASPDFTIRTAKGDVVEHGSFKYG